MLGPVWAPCCAADQSAERPSVVSECDQAHLEQTASYGNLQQVCVQDFLYRAEMLELLNQDLLRLPTNWNAYLWMNRRHWAVVLLPALEGQLRVYSGHVKMSRFEEAKEAEEDLKMLPADKVFIVLELLVHNAEKDFYPCFSIYPGFDINRHNVQACGLIEGHTPLSLAEKAAEVIRSYEKYGVVGCNCQHFANDLFDGLGISCPMPEDQWVMKALGRCARVAITANGVFKGIAGAKAAATAAAAVTNGVAGAAVAGPVGAASALGVGALTITAHSVLGCAVGEGVFRGIQKGYDWVSKKHRRGQASEMDEATTEIGEDSQNGTPGTSHSASSAGNPPHAQDELLGRHETSE